MSHPVSVVCDLCEAPFTLDPRVIVDGQAMGLFTCTQCAEDNLDARADDPRCEVGLVGGSRGWAGAARS